MKRLLTAILILVLAGSVAGPALALAATPTDTTSPDYEYSNAFTVSPVDENGFKVPAPEGDAGDTITFRLPLKCNNSGGIYDLYVSPVLTTDPETWPFDINSVAYTASYNGLMGRGQLLVFEYELTISKKVTAGIKKMDFLLTYYTLGGVRQTQTVSLFMNVRKGAATAEGGESVSKPKLMIESFSAGTDKVYAGKDFDLSITLLNTSESASVKNLQMTVTEETGKILPGGTSSGSAYIGRLGKGESVTETLPFQAAPDAEVKSYKLSVAVSYESSGKEFTDTLNITVPVSQKIRLKVDEPVIYDEGWVGQSVGMYLGVNNLGKSTVYNCAVTVEGEGLSMEESYFGGNLAAGNTLRAEFNVIPQMAGEIKGTLVFSYEDAGEQPYEERKEFTLFVNEEYIPDDGMMEGMEGMENMEGMGGAGAGAPIPAWVWIAGGVVLLAGGGIAAAKLIRNRREKELEEDA